MSFAIRATDGTFYRAHRDPRFRWDNNLRHAKIYHKLCYAKIALDRLRKNERGSAAQWAKAMNAIIASVAELTTEWSVTETEHINGPTTSVFSVEAGSVSNDGNPTGTCQKCQQRPATTFWAPDGIMGAIHGMKANWCQHCVLVEQIAFCQQQIERLPKLERELTDLCKAEIG